MIKRVKDVVTNIGSGTTPKSGDTRYYENATIPWLNSGDLNNGLVCATSKYINETALQDYSTLHYYPSGSVVVAMYGASIGKTGIINFQTTVNQACCVLCPDEKQIYPYFLQLLLQLSKDKFLLESFGGTQPNISQKIVANLLIDVPPLYEQEAIAAYLDRECEKIGRQIELLGRKADAYKRLRRSIINRAVTRGLNPDAPLKPSGNDWIGDIPAQWRIERNKNLLIEHKDTVGEDKSFQLLSLTLNGVIVRDMEGGGKFPTEFNTYKKVYPNNLIFCLFDMDETPRTIGLSAHTGMITGAYDIFSAIPEQVIAEWVYYFYFAVDQIKALKPYYTGLRKVVKAQNFVNIHIPVPPIEEQKEIVAYLDEKCGKIDAIIEKIGSQVERLKELKRSLINEVVTGKRAITPASHD